MQDLTVTLSQDLTLTLMPFYLNVWIKKKSGILRLQVKIWARVRERVKVRRRVRVRGRLRGRVQHR